jgi:hypothetical protein
MCFRFSQFKAAFERQGGLRGQPSAHNAPAVQAQSLDAYRKAFHDKCKAVV